MKNLRQSGSTKLVFPRTPTPDVEVVMVNTAGGITGGDQFGLNVAVEPGATLTLTTQAAERAYRAQRDEVGTLTTELDVQAGGRLNWLPQELILFERCNLRRKLTVSLQADAQLLLVEPIVFGRTAMGEALHDARFQDRISITRAGEPLYLDGMNLGGDVASLLQRPATAAGATAMASVVMVAPDVAAHFPVVQSALPATAGASLLADDLLVIRLLAADSLELRRVLIPVLERLNNNPLPMSWRL